MKIIYHGYSCFSIKTQKATIITDPYPESLGITMPHLKADIVTVSHQHENHCNVEGVEGEPLVIDWPGEFESMGVYVRGIASFHNKKGEEDLGENTIYNLITEGKTICHMGDLGCKLPPEQLEQVGDVDILMIPVGGEHTLDAKKALEVIDQIEPRIVIPMHYQIEGMNTEFAGVENFLEIMGKKEVEPLKELEISKGTLPSDKTEVYVMEAVRR